MINLFKKIVVCFSLASCLVFTLIVPCFASVCYRDAQDSIKLHQGNLLDQITVSTRDYNTEIDVGSDKFFVNKVNTSLIQISPTDGSVDNGVIDYRLASQLLRYNYGNTSSAYRTGYVVMSQVGASDAQVSDEYASDFWEDADSSAFPGALNHSWIFGDFQTFEPHQTFPMLTDVGRFPLPTVSGSADEIILFDEDRTQTLLGITYYFPGDVSTESVVVDALLTDAESNGSISYVLNCSIDLFDVDTQTYRTVNYSVPSRNRTSVRTAGYSNQIAGQPCIIYYTTVWFELTDVIASFEEFGSFDAYTRTVTIGTDTVTYAVGRNFGFTHDVPTSLRTVAWNGGTTYSDPNVGVSFTTQACSMLYDDWVILLDSYVPTKVVDNSTGEFNPINFLTLSVGSFLNAELFPGFPLYIPLSVCISIGVLFAFLKYFAGG